MLRALLAWIKRWLMPGPIQAYQNVSQVPFDFWVKPVLQNQDGTYYCPGFEGKTIQDNPWSKVFFALAPTPGIAEVTVTRERSFDEKKPAGTDGARVTLHGTNPARIEIKLLIWTPEQLRALRDLWPLLMTPPYKTTVTSVTTRPVGLGITSSVVSTSPTAGTVSLVSIPAGPTTTTTKTTTPVTFDVSHPMFALHNIKAVQIIGGSGPDPGPVVNSRVFTIRAIEALKPGNKNVTNTDVAANGSALDQNAYQTPGTNTANLGP